MRAIIINPYARTIREIDHDGSLGAMYATIRCSTVCMVRISPSDCLWLDDNGMLTEGKPVWYFGDYPNPLAGIGLILGVTMSGRNRDTRIPVAQLMAIVKWTDLESTGRLEPSRMVEGPIEHGGMQFDFASIGGAPILRSRTSEARA